MKRGIRCSKRRVRAFRRSYGKRSQAPRSRYGKRIRAIAVL